MSVLALQYVSIPDLSRRTRGSEGALTFQSGPEHPSAPAMPPDMPVYLATQDQQRVGNLCAGGRECEPHSDQPALECS